MTKMTLREKKRAERIAKRRRQRIIIGIVIGLAVLFVAYLVVNSLTDEEPETTGNSITTDSGLIYEDLTVGSGDAAQVGDTVSVHYTGWLEDGTEFDSSVGGSPYEFTLGTGNVIPGWDEGLVGMQAGGKRKLTIPPDLAYGETGFGSTIPPDSTLTFEVELLEIK